MFLFNAMVVGLKEIWANRFRSMLTMLGIILGVSSLVAMSAVVKGMENAMKESLIAMGGLDKVTSDDQEVPVEQQHLADQAVKRSIRDVMALKNSAHMLKLVSPEMELNRAILTRGEKSARPSELVGVWPAVLDMNLHTLQYGRFFTALDEELANPVIVIGTGIRDELFGSPEETGKTIVPIGEVIQVNDQSFTIVGMFEHYEGEQDRKMREEMARRAKEETKAGGVERRRGWGSRRWSPFYRKNMTAYIPLNTMWLRFRASDAGDSVPDPSLTALDVKVRDLSRIDESLQQAKNVMMVTHNGVENFSFNTQEGNIEEIDTNIRNARRSGGLISGIALLVGGIGIMNIMLASITERIREIGIRKAIGASTSAIFLQILVESVVISVFGGVLGVFCSYGFVDLLSWLTPSQTTPEVTAASLVIAFCFSVGVGIIAGITPAIKAARLHPIQALRFD
jgi:putative ABC transport system permease protein